MCGSCNASYIGMTKRHLQTRTDEHRGISRKTGAPIYTSLHSSIRTHLHSTGHEFSFTDFKIICSARTDKELYIKESLMIRRDN